MKENISRKKFLGSVGILAASAFCPVKIIGADLSDVPEGTGKLLKCNTYLQSPTKNSITVRWITSVPAYSYVMYGNSVANVSKKVSPVTDGLLDAYNTINGITIDNLEPGKTYYYQIISSEILEFFPNKVVYAEPVKGEIGSFQTLKEEKSDVEILILNDIHDRPESFGVLLTPHQFKSDFIFLNGDMFNWQTGEEQLIGHLIDPLTQASEKNIPFILSRGNHETRGLFARKLHSYFNEPGQNFYYSFTHGPLYIIVLDSGEDKPDDTIVYGGIVAFDAYREKQKIWLENEVKKEAFKKAPFRLVFSHIPTHYSGEGHGTLHCRKMWSPLLNQSNIDLMISGHTHKFGIHPAVKGEHNYPIVIGGGPKNGVRTVMKLNATAKKLNLIAFNDSATQIGEFEI